MTMSAYDLVCVGGGLGGLTAAAVASSRGARCLVLEATDRIGGVAAYSGGSVWVPLNSLHRRQGDFDDTEQEVTAYLDHLDRSGAAVDSDLRSSYVDRGPSVIDELVELGVEFHLKDAGDYYPEAPGWKARGRTLAVRTDLASLGSLGARLREAPYDFADARGAASSSSADDQVLERGRALTGAIARAALIEGNAELQLGARATHLGNMHSRGRTITYQQSGRSRTVTAHTVLLATSGYGWAPFAAQMEGLVNYAEQAPPIAHGDALQLAGDLGAAVVRAGNGFFSVGFRSAREVHPGTNVPLIIPMVASMAVPHCFVVNARGHRFDDESFAGTFQSRLREYDDDAKQFRNQPCFFVCDDQYRRNGYRPIGLERDWPHAEFARAESLLELGERLGFDGRATEATARRFNRFAEDGVDPDFGRGKRTFMAHLSDDRYPNPMLGPVSEPPFWGVELVPAGAGICSHGLHIDDSARVLRWDGTAVPGVHATGNATAFTELPHGYQDGFANGRNIIYAGIAARRAASAASRVGSR